MKKTPVLSFIIPVYKKPAVVFERCLSSLFDQSFKAFEVICVFDGPDPDLEAVASRFKVQSLVIEHGGAPKARNAGFEKSKGRYVSFWDCDTYAKPEMAGRWMQEFERTGADFVYSGYEWVNEGGGYDSEPFDAYSLESGNYISTMFPVKREFVPGFDESLKAAQDWDYWLRIVKAGAKGSFIQGYGFVTEGSGPGSVSYEGWSTERRDETIRIVREKNEIPDRKVTFCSMRYNTKALHLAKICGGDFYKPSGYRMDHYDLVFNLGYGPFIRFDEAKKSAVRVHYWMPWDVECLFQIAYKTAKETIRLANEEITHHFTNDILCKKKLKELGIEAEVLPLPSDTDEIVTSLPAEFRVLVDADRAYAPIFQSLAFDMPYVKVDYLDKVGAADATNYSMLLSFNEFPTVDEAIRRALINGRHVISNVQSPYCGYLDPNVSHEVFKAELINRIREARNLPFNSEAQKYYLDLVDPEKFKKKVFSLLQKPVMELV